MTIEYEPDVLVDTEQSQETLSVVPCDDHHVVVGDDRHVVGGDDRHVVGGDDRHVVVDTMMVMMMMVTCETSADTRLERKTPAYNFSKSLQNDHQPPDDAFDAVVREGWDILVIFPVWILTRDPLGKLFCHHLPVGRR